MGRLPAGLACRSPCVQANATADTPRCSSWHSSSSCTAPPSCRSYTGGGKCQGAGQARIQFQVATTLATYPFFLLCLDNSNLLLLFNLPPHFIHHLLQLQSCRSSDLHNGREKSVTPFPPPPIRRTWFNTHHFQGLLHLVSQLLA